MNIWLLLLIFFGVSLLACSVGFKKFIWFLSVGYGFSVIALGIAYLVYGIVDKCIDVIAILQIVLLAVYGFRLSFFLLTRDLKNVNYQKSLKDTAANKDKKMPLFVLVTIWISVGLLYVMQTGGVFFRIYNIKNDSIDNIVLTTILPIVGIAISFIGLLLESLADSSKSRQKKVNPNMVATKGLYKMCRCPNYFGEILFWTGIYVGSAGIFGAHVEQWIIATIGYICIVFIMINGAQRLDKKQEKRYGEIEEYRKYADHTPLVFPLIPISHIGKYKESDVEGNERKK